MKTQLYELQPRDLSIVRKHANATEAAAFYNLPTLRVNIQHHLAGKRQITVYGHIWAKGTSLPEAQANAAKAQERWAASVLFADAFENMGADDRRETKRLTLKNLK